MVCVCPVVRILLIFKIFFPTRNIFCWLNCPAVLGRWWWWKLLGEVTRERAAAEQKSVVLAGAEWGRETWDRCHFVYGLIVKYWEFRLLLSIKRYFNKKHISNLLHLHSRYLHTYYLQHSFWHKTIWIFLTSVSYGTVACISLNFESGLFV